MLVGLLHFKNFVFKIFMAQGGFIRKKVETLTLGERLSKWREERHMTVADVSRNTGIQVSYVEYLEREEFEKLPAEVYVRGFLRRYAEFLGIPEALVLRQYERERGMSRSIGNSGHEEEDSMQRSAFRNIPAAIVTPARMTIAAFGLLAIAAFLYVYTQYRTFVSEPVLSVLEPSEEAMRTTERSVQVSGKTDPDSRIYINDQPVLVDENGGFREKIDLQKGVNTVTVRSINRFNKEARRVYSIEANFSEGDQKETSSVSEVISGKKVVIRTGKDPMLVIIAVDGEQKVNGVAPAGSRWEFSVKNDMMISAGDGKNIYATIGEKGAESALSDKSGPISGYKLDMKKNLFVP